MIKTKWAKEREHKYGEDFKISLFADDIEWFIKWFNANIQSYGGLTVADLKMMILHEKPSFVDNIYGWTDLITAKDHFKIHYAKYGEKLPYFTFELKPHSLKIGDL